MIAIDLLTCFAVGGISSLFGLVLLFHTRSDHPRLHQVLRIYRGAFMCLSMLGILLWVPEGLEILFIQIAMGFAGIGVSMLAWAFRQLNGGRTPPLIGMAACTVVGPVLWAGMLLPLPSYVLLVPGVFSIISVVMALDQGWLIWRSSNGHASERGLMVIAALFALHWLLVLHHASHVVGDIPADLLYAPAWLRPFSAIGMALLPMVVATLTLTSINARLSAQLRARALSDDLTGSLSRRGLRELGGRMVALQHNRTAHLAVLMIDIDGFKAINASFGSAIGDEVIRHVNQVVRDRLRNDALLARHGGEEFTVLLPMAQPHEAYIAAERLRNAIEQNPYTSRKGVVRVTASIGVAFHGRGGSLDEDLAHAETCLQAAKKAGRNRVEFHGRHTHA